LENVRLSPIRQAKPAKISRYLFVLRNRSTVDLSLFMGVITLVVC